MRDHYRRLDAARLIPALIDSDAEAFGNQLPGYRADPMGATRAAIQALQTDPAHARRFAAFQRDMVFGERIEFASALAELESILKQVDARGA